MITAKAIALPYYSRVNSIWRFKLIWFKSNSIASLKGIRDVLVYVSTFMIQVNVSFGKAFWLNYGQIINYYAFQDFLKGQLLWG